MELEQKGLEMGETLDEITEGIFELLAERGNISSACKVAFDFCRLTGDAGWEAKCRELASKLDE